MTTWEAIALLKRACNSLFAAALSSDVKRPLVLEATADNVARLCELKSTATLPSSIADEMPRESYCAANHSRAFAARVAGDVSVVSTVAAAVSCVLAR